MLLSRASVWLISTVLMISYVSSEIVVRLAFPFGSQQAGGRLLLKALFSGLLLGRALQISDIPLGVPSQLVAVPSLCSSMPPHPWPLSPTPARWTTCSSPVRVFISKSAMREFVPSNRISLIRALAFSTLSYMRRYE